jgi:hypothetical protein
MALKAAYRLLSNAKVTHENILHPHVERTRRRCGERGEYLLIEDTTALSFTHREGVHGMGPLTQQGTQGFLVHTNLAMRVENWDEENSPSVTLVGVFSQQCWVREKPTGTRAERKRDKRVAKKSGKTGESARWARGLQEMGTPPSGTCWTLVADRECDIFEVLAQCAHQRVGWIIRAAQNRKTAWGVGSLFTEVAQAPVLGTYALELRARPGSPARVARVELRALTTEILPPQHLRSRYTAQAVNVVQVREIDAPAGVEPLHWLLLTNWSVEAFDRARRVVNAYACRWLIEEYHKALKTGTHIEESQLSTADRIETLLGIHAAIAADLLALKLLGASRPDAPVPADLLAPESLQVLERKVGRPDGAWTCASLIRAIARMGGYLGRKHDGPPGWLSIWRGWLRLKVMTEGYVLAQQFNAQDTYG